MRCPAVDATHRREGPRARRGCDMSLAARSASPRRWTKGFGVGIRSLADNPYDEHTLGPALEQVEILTEHCPDLAVVDRGYRGHGVDKTRVLISGTRRGLTPKLLADLRRRSAIEPELGHMKADSRLSRCTLKGTIGDALFAVLCGRGHSIRNILARLRALLAMVP